MDEYKSDGNNQFNGYGYHSDGSGNAAAFNNDYGYGNTADNEDGNNTRDFLSQAPAFSAPGGYTIFGGAPYVGPSSMR